MKIYFVRHGQSEYNINKMYQHPDVGLSVFGKKQAEILAKRFKKIPIDVIFASSFKRAKQTAEIINKVLKKKVIYSDLFRDAKIPSEFIGRKNSELTKIHEIIDRHSNNSTWHYSDEENFFEFKERAKKIIEYLVKLKKENILVVTHGGVVKMIIFLLSLEDKVSLKFFRKFAFFFKAINTGITLFQTDENGKLRLLTWNDHSHL